MDRLQQRPERPAIDITWVSCRGVRSSLPFHTPCLYASVSVTSSAGKNRRPHRVRTPTDRAGGENPEWDDERLRLYLPDGEGADASSPASELHADDGGVLLVRFEVKAEVAVLGDVLAASAVVPLPDLVADGRTHRVSYQLAVPSDSRQHNGVISFSYVFHDGDHDHDEEDRRSDGDPAVPVTPPCPAPAGPLAPVSFGMYPVIDDWPSMEQLAPLMEQSAVYPPPLRADTVTVTGSRYYYDSTPPVQPAAIYPPLTTELSAPGIYPTVGEPHNGLYPTVDLAPVSYYPPTTAPCYGRGFGYPAIPDWDTRCLYS
ncbi:unnamed protein product [Alopecurus aequalis]